MLLRHSICARGILIGFRLSRPGSRRPLAAALPGRPHGRSSRRRVELRRLRAGDADRQRDVTVARDRGGWTIGARDGSARRSIWSSRTFRGALRRANGGRSSCAIDAIDKRPLTSATDDNRRTASATTDRQTDVRHDATDTISRSRHPPAEPVHRRRTKRCRSACDSAPAGSSCRVFGAANGGSIMRVGDSHQRTDSDRLAADQGRRTRVENADPAAAAGARSLRATRTAGSCASAFPARTSKSPAKTSPRSPRARVIDPAERRAGTHPGERVLARPAHFEPRGGWPGRCRPSSSSPATGPDDRDETVSASPSSASSPTPRGRRLPGAAIRQARRRAKRRADRVGNAHRLRRERVPRSSSLSDRKDVDRRRITLVGHSEGGSVAMLGPRRKRAPRWC